MATRMSKPKWIFLYAFSGGMDIIQFVVIELILVWFFGAGVAINEVLDPIVGVVIACFLQFIGGVSLIRHPSRLISMFGMEAFSAISGGIAQLWVLDVWYIHSTVKAEEAEEQQQLEEKEMQQAVGPGPLYDKDGTRQPRPKLNNSNANGAARAPAFKNGTGKARSLIHK